MRRNQKGFTLMELMVVIVIVAILAAVAVPLYINYVKDAQRTEAKGAIGAVITAQQTNFQVKSTYANATFVKTPTDVNAQQGGLNCDLTESLANWNISTTGDVSGYTVRAEGIGPQTTGLIVRYVYTRATGVGQFFDSDAP